MEPFFTGTVAKSPSPTLLTGNAGQSATVTLPAPPGFPLNGFLLFFCKKVSHTAAKIPKIGLKMRAEHVQDGTHSDTPKTDLPFALQE